MIKKGSNVKVLVGKDKNKTGEIIELDRKKNRAKIKGINMIKKHVKTTKEKKGGIVDKENFIHLSNLSLIENKKKKVEKSKKWNRDKKKKLLKKYSQLLRKNLVTKIILWVLKLKKLLLIWDLV